MHDMVHGQRSEDKLRCHSSPSTLFETESHVQCPVNKTSLWTWEALPSPPLPFGSSGITDVSYCIRLYVEFGDLSSASTSPAEPSLKPAFPNSCWFKSGWWTLEHVLAKLRENSAVLLRSGEGDIQNEKRILCRVKNWSQLWSQCSPWRQGLSPV